eukprot:365429-Chlamydomonas_euryale.AAC.17
MGNGSAVLACALCAGASAMMDTGLGSSATATRMSSASTTTDTVSMRGVCAPGDSAPMSASRCRTGVSSVTSMGGAEIGVDACVVIQKHRAQVAVSILDPTFFRRAVRKRAGTEAQHTPH